MTVLISLLLSLFGLVTGSFAGAQVWRLRARQLAQDKAAGWDYDTKEYKRLKNLIGQKTTEDRSRCLSCGHELSARDLVPLASWLGTRGKCRYCKTPIGRFEPMIELGTAVTFGGFGFFWLSAFGLLPFSLLLLVLWLAAITMLIILFAYDLKWFLLPDVVMFPLIGLSILIFLLSLKAFPGNTLNDVISVFASVGILSGLYLVLWLISKGMWVGFGDVKLGIVLGVLVVDWKLALMTLFLANLIGTLIVLPGLLTGRLSRKAQVPFGPFLIVGFFISIVAGATILNGYASFTQWLSTVLLML